MSIAVASCLFLSLSLTMSLSLWSSIQRSPRSLIRYNVFAVRLLGTDEL